MISRSRFLLMICYISFLTIGVLYFLGYLILKMPLGLLIITGGIAVISEVIGIVFAFRIVKKQRLSRVERERLEHKGNEVHEKGNGL